jgi:O-antigen/teichoic acid export membrane protein
MSNDSLKEPAQQSQRVAASYLVGERMIRMLLGFFIHTWMARSFSAEDFGFISFTVKSVSVYFAFGLFGVDEVIIKLLVGNTHDRRDILRTALLLRLGLGTVGWLVVTLLTGFSTGFGSTTWITCALFGVSIPLQAFTVYELPFMAKMAMKPVFVARNTSYLVGVFAKVAVFWQSWSRSVFVATYTLEEVMWKALIFLKAHAHGFSGGQWRPEIAKALWSSGLLAFLASFVALFDQRVAFLVLESHSDGQLLGAYAVVIALFDMLTLLPVSLAMALFPKVASAKGTSPAEYQRERQKMSNLLVWSGVFLSVSVYFAAPMILTLLYHGKYDHALPLLRGMGFTSVWTFFNIGRFKWFAIENALGDWLCLSLVSLVLQMVMLKHIVPLYGLNGVAVSLAVGQLGASVLMSPRKVVRSSWMIFLRAFVPARGRQ